MFYRLRKKHEKDFDFTNSDDTKKMNDLEIDYVFPAYPRESYDSYRIKGRKVEYLIGVDEEKINYYKYFYNKFNLKSINKAQFEAFVCYKNGNQSDCKTF